MSPLALITGTSSGIGKAFAERLAGDGYDLIVVARREDRLTALAASLPGVAVQVVAADLSTDEGIDTVAKLCASQPPTMLVNNAGVAHYMPMVELPAEKARALPHVDDAMVSARAIRANAIARTGGSSIGTAEIAALLAFHSSAHAIPTNTGSRSPSGREPR